MYIMYNICKASARRKRKGHLIINMFEKHYFFIKTFFYHGVSKKFTGFFLDILAKEEKPLFIMSILLKKLYKCRSHNPNKVKLTNCFLMNC